jgi:hypothetical protein
LFQPNGSDDADTDDTDYDEVDKDDLDGDLSAVIREAEEEQYLADEFGSENQKRLLLLWGP